MSGRNNSITNLTIEEINDLRKAEISKELSTFEVIKKHFEDQDSVILTPKQAELRNRWLFVWHHMLQGTPTSDIYKIAAEEFFVTETTVSNYIRDAKKLFGDIETTNRLADAAIAKDLALQAHKMGKDTQDARGMAAAAKAFNEAAGLNSRDQEIPDFSKLPPPIIIISLPDHQLQMLAKLFDNKPVIDISKMMDNLAEDAEITE